MEVLGVVDLPVWMILLILIIIYLIYSTRDFDYFKKQGLPYLRPWPFMGTALTFFRKGFVKYQMDLMEQYGGDSIVGEFGMRRPSIIVYNGDFLSKIMVRDFTSFTNRFIVTTGSVTTNNMLPGLKDERWRHVRNEMSPTFTTGKLKKMNSEINRCAQCLVTNLRRACDEGGEISTKSYTGPFTMDVIASTAFGIRVNSQENPDDPFVLQAREAFDIQLAKPEFLIAFLFPKLADLMVYLGYTFEILGKEPVAFFRKVTKQALSMRQEDKQNVHEDFLQLMIRAQRGEDIRDGEVGETGEEAGETREGEEPQTASLNQAPGLTSDEIFANAIIFFVAGYDTTATSLQFFLHNMARFPDEQQRLYDEIHKVIGDQETVDYQKLSDMPYLDQCVMENLRMFPPAVTVDRMARQDATIDNVYFRKNLMIHIPIYAIHHDPKRWPDPYTFKPERFSPDNKKLQHTYDFIPFGQGPRNCIGMRLALLEIKVAIIYMLRAFKISACDKTLETFTWQNQVTLTPNEEVVVRIEER